MSNLDKSEELQWMEFETRMRKNIKDLVAPVVERAQEDRGMLLKLRTAKKDYKTRIHALENAVFKTKDSKTIFEKFENKLLD